MPAQLTDKLYAERIGIGGTITVQEIVDLSIEENPLPKITVSIIAPPTPQVGDLWVDTN